MDVVAEYPEKCAVVMDWREDRGKSRGRVGTATGSFWWMVEVGQGKEQGATGLGNFQWLKGKDSKLTYSDGSFRINCRWTKLQRKT
jgi:hypothetical protein